MNSTGTSSSRLCTPQSLDISIDVPFCHTSLLESGSYCHPATATCVSTSHCHSATASCVSTSHCHLATATCVSCSHCHLATASCVSTSHCHSATATCDTTSQCHTATATDTCASTSCCHSAPPTCFSTSQCHSATAAATPTCVSTFQCHSATTTCVITSHCLSVKDAEAPTCASTSSCLTVTSSTYFHKGSDPVPQASVTATHRTPLTSLRNFLAHRHNDHDATNAVVSLLHPTQDPQCVPTLLTTPPSTTDLSVPSNLDGNHAIDNIGVDNNNTDDASLRSAQVLDQQNDAKLVKPRVIEATLLNIGVLGSPTTLPFKPLHISSHTLPNTKLPLHLSVEEEGAHRGLFPRGRRSSSVVSYIMYQVLDFHYIFLCMQIFLFL